MRVTGYVLRGDGATITFDDGKVYELVYVQSFTEDSTLDQKYKDAIANYLNSTSTTQLDPRFSGIKKYYREIQSTDWVSGGPMNYHINIPPSEHGLGQHPVVVTTRYNTLFGGYLVTFANVVIGDDGTISLYSNTTDVVRIYGA